MVAVALVGGGGCTVSTLDAVGRPCGDEAPCGPGTYCDPVTSTCVEGLARDGQVKDLPGAPDATADLSGADGAAADLSGADLAADGHGPDRAIKPDVLKKPDAAKPDMPKKPDAAKPDTKRSCDQIYGTAPGYVLCKETATTCEFNANTNPDCHTICTSYAGQTCLGAFDNPLSAGQECNVKPGSNDDCFTTNSTEICVCSRN